MSDIKDLENQLADAKLALAEIAEEQDSLGQQINELREKRRSLSPKYGEAIEAVNALAQELSALKNPDGVANIVAVGTATEEGSI